MIKVDVATRNLEVDEKLKAYVEEKIGSLEKYLPRRARENADCKVILEDDPNGREDNRYVCEAVFNANGTVMVSREGTVNAYAAVDIVEAKLKTQLQKFKEKVALEPRRGRRLSEWLGRRQEPAPEADPTTTE